jgi:hypothetical protein
MNLGLPKSGTTTLARALRRAGLHTADFRIRAGQTRDPDRAGAFVADLLYRGYFHSGDPLQHLQGFDALSEVSLLRGAQSLWPQTDWALLEAIRAQHPEMRFVASSRNAVAMSDSMLRWSNLGTERLPRAAVPCLPAGFGATTAERVRWIEGHYAALTRFFAGSDRFLLFDTAAPDTPARLAAFLGRELPWWGRANANRPRAVA